MFQLGEHISFATSERTYTLTIVDQPFAPFTEAVVLPVRCPELGPDTMVAKIYGVPEDDDNGGDGEDGSGEGAEREDHEGGDNDYSVDDRSDGSEGRDHRPHLIEEDQAVEHAVGAMWEEDFRRLYRHFASERDAYAHLLPLQGTAIPRLFLVGTWLPPDERAYQLPALVMEYIPDAVTLGDIAGDVLDPQMCTALVRAIESFPKYGV